jgi:hypothetical protein
MSNTGLGRYRALFPGMMSWQTRSDGPGAHQRALFSSAAEIALTLIVAVLFVKRTAEASFKREKS